ncbi:hypothetical protein ACFYY8_31805 [Streptosporangium sp. NPDC001559]|uniref:hypothetical protein n=1 Tax=Streptosporangium sp. NPDC001559 TaxID=3366187 RepID=UPI0036E51ED9
MDEKLTAVIEADNAAEDAGMHPDDRVTCWTHQGWATDCATNPIHTNPGATHHYRYRPEEG